MKLLTLQQNPNLADELQRQDDDQQKVLTYLSDGSFDGLKESLGIVESLNSAKKIDTLDDLAQDDAV
ncbi:MAG: hypothetical protein H6766_07885 [Candidatus Peribacteria bacterium]|nr:MAG: hypothetical protein H6766_07885 [Candidatus Peribacteria bacterium]